MVRDVFLQILFRHFEENLYFLLEAGTKLSEGKKHIQGAGCLSIPQEGKMTCLFITLRLWHICMKISLWDMKWDPLQILYQ